MSRRFFADDPIPGKDADQLQRLAFARQIAKLCGQVGEQSETSVLALIGPWGSGKSSILSLVQEDLTSAVSSWQVVKFNPWLFSDVESLLQSFFGALGTALPEKRFKAARQKLGSYAETVASLGKLASLVGVDVSAMVSKLGEVLRGDASAEARRVELEEELRKLDQKILVIIDDIDRLQPTELLAVFKMIRLAARLPNVYYLLAYDERTVLDVLMRSELAHEAEDRAQNYLEKIVQIRLDLPPLHEEQQVSLLDDGLEQLMKLYGVTLSDDDSHRLGEAYHFHLAGFLKEPRAINRFLAQVSAIFPLVHEEVDFVDFLMLTFLRTFQPGVYSVVLARKLELTGQDIARSFREEGNGPRKARWLDILAGAKVTEAKRESTLRLLAGLFLPLRSAVENMTYGSHFYNDLARGKHVGSSDYFDRYFQFGIPTSDISDRVVLAAVAQMGSGGPELDLLTRRMQQKPELVLRKIDSLLESSAIENPVDVLHFVSGYYKELLKVRQFLRSPELYLIGVSRRLAAHVADEQVVSFIKAVVEADRMEFAIAFALRATGREPDREWVADVTDVLRSALSERFDRASQLELSEVSDDEIDLIHRWGWIQEDQPKIREAFWRAIASGKWPLVTLLGRLVPEATSYGGGAPRRTIGDLNPAYLDQLLGIDRVIEALDRDYVGWEQRVNAKRVGDVSQESKEVHALIVLENLKSQRVASSLESDSSSPVAEGTD